MIPNIETIVEDLSSGNITKAQAVTWLHAHAEGAANKLRDYFAGQALIGWRESERTIKSDADEAYMLADAMMAARIKRQAD